MSMIDMSSEVSAYGKPSVVANKMLPVPTCDHWARSKSAIHACSFSPEVCTEMGVGRTERVGARCRGISAIGDEHQAIIMWDQLSVDLVKSACLKYTIADDADKKESCQDRSRAMAGGKAKQLYNELAQEDHREDIGSHRQDYTQQ